MRKGKVTRILALAALLGLAGTGAGWAGPTEESLLKSYVGTWNGESMLVGGQSAEPFRCRLSVTPGKLGKINYAGRCALVNMSLSVSGTIAYVEAGGRYEAVMSSNAGFSGVAVGREDGGQIGFDLADRQKDRGGNDVAIGSKLFLAEESIVVIFQVEFNNSGQVLTANVPFSR